jgi:ATP-dependent DNA helicase RecQ
VQALLDRRDVPPGCWSGPASSPSIPTGSRTPGRGPEPGGDAAAAAAAIEEDHRRVERSRIEMLRGYAEDDACRRELRLTYFGEPFEPPCGACDNGEAGLATAATEPRSDPPFPLQARVHHTSWGAGRVLRYAGDRMVVLSTGPATGRCRPGPCWSAGC